MVDETGRWPATLQTVAAQRSFADRLAPDDGADFERVARGFIAGPSEAAIPNTGRSAMWAPFTWEFGRGDFVSGDAPDTVNPSLWRQAKLNSPSGLFEVVDGFYQVRGFDTSVVTFVRGATGWLVIDPLTTVETAGAALSLVREHLEDLPVVAVIYTHAHVDHYGGILGVTTREQVESGEIPVIAPDGFLRAAVDENVVAGAAMGRRAMYQYGLMLPWDERGHVDQGLAKGVPIGSITLVAPTIDITHTGQELSIDGVEIEFQLTPESESPAEMHFYFPQHRVLCLAENCTGTMHNLLTLRGALVRDALSWSRYIDEAIDLWGDDVEVSIASHSWPHWGRSDVVEHMTRQRDLYRWMHDEALRLANLGYSPDEIAAVVELPPGLWNDFSCHGYYGTVSHNVRAVYQRYLGWYDGHPSSLDPYPPVEAGERYVRFMGGIDQLVTNARASFEDGDYRWVAQVLRHAVSADPSHREARDLLAAAFEQLGYQAESGPWRDAYITGAMELRADGALVDFPFQPNADVVAGMQLDQIFDYLAIRANGPRLVDLGDFQINWVLEDDEDTRISISNGTLHAVPGRLAEEPAATITSPRAALSALARGDRAFPDLLADSDATVDGDRVLVEQLWGTLDSFPLFFPIIEPGVHARKGEA